MEKEKRKPRYVLKESKLLEAVEKEPTRK